MAIGMGMNRSGGAPTPFAVAALGPSPGKAASGGLCMTGILQGWSSSALALPSSASSLSSLTLPNTNIPAGPVFDRRPARWWNTGVCSPPSASSMCKKVFRTETVSLGPISPEASSTSQVFDDKVSGAASECSTYMGPVEAPVACSVAPGVGSTTTALALQALRAGLAAVAVAAAFAAATTSGAMLAAQRPQAAAASSAFASLEASADEMCCCSNKAG
mmetsp:Transcript_62932/g.184063  ORF Transcript_62932/g.184063 Transcript_62932/m.184063 type:complete len:218 (-) Transcript_62932:485-1138(-)